MLEKTKRKYISRRISILLACVLGIVPSLVSMSPGVAGAESRKTAVFSDIDGSYAKEAILKLKDSGVVSGEGDGKFYPKRVITRAEASKFIVLALGLEQDPMGARAFKDIPKESWYAGYVGALAKAGILQGTSASSFSPKAQVTREQLAVLFIRAMGLQEQLIDNKGFTSITDWDKVSEWAKPSVQLAMNIDFMKGIDNENGSIRFEPKASAERQAIALLTNEMITNKSMFIERAKKKNEETKPNTNTSTNDKKAANSSSANSIVGGGGAANGGGSSGGGGDAGNNDNTSKPVSHTPVVTEAVYNVAGTKVSGIAEKEAKVAIYHKGKIIAEGQSDLNGNFTIDIPNRHMFLISAGDTIAITAQVDGKEISSPLEKTVNQGRKPTSAKIYGYIDEDSGVVGTQDGFSFDEMIITKEDGTIIECENTYGVGEKRVCSFSLDHRLFVPYEKLKVYAMLRGLSVSDPTNIEVQPIKGKTEFMVVTSAVYDGLSYVDIRAPKFTHITITDSKHSKLETSAGYYKNEGTRFTFDGSDLEAGETIYISANGYMKEKSDPLPIMIKSTNRVETPTVTGVVYNDGGFISGHTEPMSMIFLYTEKGEFISSFSTNMGGYFKKSFSVPDGLVISERLKITAKKINKKESLPAFIDSRPVIGKTKKPEVPAQINAADYWIRGYAEPNSEIRIKKSDGTLIWNMGFFEHDIFYGGIPIKGLGEILVTADTIGKEESDPVRVEVLESETTETPIIIGDVYNIHPIFSGTTVPGAEVIVASLNGHGLLNHNTVSIDGTFRIESSGTFEPGDEFAISARIEGKWYSEPAIVTLLPSKAPKTAVPTVVTAAVYENGGMITGTAIPYARVVLKDEFGRVLDSTRLGFDGIFTFTLQDAEVMYRKKLYITATEDRLYESDKIEIPFLPVNGVTPKPTVIDTVYREYGIFRVTTIPNALVIAMDEQGLEMDKRRADHNGDVTMNLAWRSRPEKLTIFAEGFGLERSEPVYVEVISRRN